MGYDGREINPEISGIIKDIMKIEIDQYKGRIQYSEIEHAGLPEEYIVGNSDDCGPILIYLMTKAAQGQELPSLPKIEDQDHTRVSKEIGQGLRNIFLKSVRGVKQPLQNIDVLNLAGATIYDTDYMLADSGEDSYRSVSDTDYLGPTIYRQPHGVLSKAEREKRIIPKPGELEHSISDHISKSIVVSTRIQEQGESHVISALDIAGRAPSLIGGGVQGDHASAYALFEECVCTAIKDLPLDLAIVRVVHIIDRYTDVIVDSNLVQNIVEYVKKEIESKGYVSADDLETFAQTINDKHGEEAGKLAREAFDRSNATILSNAITDLVKVHLTLRNQLPLTTFPSEGDMPPKKNEGNIVLGSLNFFRKLAETGVEDPIEAAIIVMKQKSKSKVENVTEDEAVKEIVKNITYLLHYPMIEDSVLLTDKEFAKEAEKRKQKYREGTKQRDNDPEKLKQVLANHVELLFLVFPILAQNDEAREKIIKEFSVHITKDWEGTILQGSIEEDLSARVAQEYDPASTPGSESLSSKTHRTGSSEAKQEEGGVVHGIDYSPSSLPSSPIGSLDKSQKSHKREHDSDEERCGGSAAKLPKCQEEQQSAALLPTKSFTALFGPDNPQNLTENKGITK